MAADDPSPHDETQTVRHVSTRKRRGRPQPKIQLSLTAMIDVIFLLLIYFVITANFAVDEGVLTAKLPRGAAKAQTNAPPKNPLNIVLQSHGAAACLITVGSTHQMTSFTKLAGTLASLQFDPAQGRQSGVFKPDNPVIIKPEGQVRWQHVVNAFNATILARYTNVSFAQAQE